MDNSIGTKILRIVMNLQKDGKITSDQKDDFKGKYKNKCNYNNKINKRENDE